MTTAFEAAREAASTIDPHVAARNCGFDYDGSTAAGTFAARYLNRAISLPFPSLDGRFADTGGAVPEPVVTLLSHYLVASDGTEPAGTWISFADLPGGRVYCSAWRGYTGKALVRRFGNDVDAVRAAAVRLGREALDLSSDLAIRLDVLPKVPVALLYWAGDEEFEPRADFLFDATASHHLPTDCCAVACGLVTRELVGEGPS